ncbi:UNKNOWN [Stylonychia lemnae]|uniref:Transmembrane protein n=1 Tax=Stylonychia lemnae TaxID=5949 RepID=A0A078BDK2_STYLE|nr:UNKNOWN [Stylonychia lemnae]|eukprot:CDW91668.1 UNKNOWN [Stylonychia lemnae]
MKQEKISLIVIQFIYSERVIMRDVIFTINDVYTDNFTSRFIFVIKQICLYQPLIFDVFDFMLAFAFLYFTNQAMKKNFLIETSSNEFDQPQIQQVSDESESISQDKCKIRGENFQSESFHQLLKNQFVKKHQKNSTKQKYKINSEGSDKTEIEIQIEQISENFYPRQESNDINGSLLLRDQSFV